MAVIAPILDEFAEIEYTGNYIGDAPDDVAFQCGLHCVQVREHFLVVLFDCWRIHDPRQRALCVQCTSTG